MTVQFTQDAGRRAAVIERYKSALPLETELGEVRPRILEPLDSPRSRADQTADISSLLLWQHVEPLLDQAASLLDRCLRGRAEWNELREKTFLLDLELKEYFRLHEVHEAEIKAGVYELDHGVASETLKAEQAALLGQGEAAKILEERLNTFLTPEEVKAEAGHRAARARHLAFPFYNEGLPPLEFGKPLQDKIKWAEQDDQRLELRNLSIERLQTLAEIRRVQGEVNGQANRVEAAKLKAAYEDQNRDFRLRRTMVSKKIMDFKTEEASRAGGALNYAERFADLEKHFEADFEHAVQRLAAVEVGLDKVYKFPAGMALRPTPDQRPTIDRATLWTRLAIHRLTAVQLKDVAFSVPISLRRFLEIFTWQQLLEKGAITFDVTRDLFPNQNLVRLRGVSCFMNGSNVSGFLGVRLMAPDTALFLYPDGTSATHSQGNSGSLYLRRVGRSNDELQPEVVGSQLIHNFSPLGRWSIALDTTTSGGTARTQIQDVELHLHVVAQT